MELSEANAMMDDSCKGEEEEKKVRVGRMERRRVMRKRVEEKQENDEEI